ncbi:MAG TPA: hypothetical protein PLB95_08090 [Syntrophales bacterium]|nr:hypothetical protein [Syntrophales bacterium]
MDTRHFPHLCQPDACKSCGACCGLYNYADSSRDTLVRRLRRRTALMGRANRSPAGLEEFARMIRDTEDMTKRYEVIYCCEYLGFLDLEERRVGCLLHPLQNDGVDYREVSFYGRELCDGHFCPSYHYLSGAEKHSLLHVIDDWYLYGLVVTDIDLVKSYFRLISDGVYETPDPECFRSGPLHESTRSFFSLKLTWPFRAADVHRLGKYYFDGSQYMVKYIDYEALGMGKSRFDQVFMSLSSEFSCREDVRAAEEIIARHIGEFIDTYRNYK